MICSLSELGFLDSGMNSDDGIYEVDSKLVEELNLKSGDEIPETIVDGNKYVFWKTLRKDFEKTVLPQWQDINNLKEIQYLLSWDQQVLMPSSANTQRASQSTTIAGLIHEKESDFKYHNTVTSVSQNPALNRFERRSVELALQECTKSKAADPATMKELTRLGSECSERWGKARELGKFAIVQPIWKDLIEVTKQYAEELKNASESVSQQTFYDCLVDGFSKDVSTSTLTTIFETIRQGVLPIVQQVKKPSSDILEAPSNPFEIAKQESLSKFVIENVVGGKRFERLSIFKSRHPFAVCVAHAADVRVSSRLSPLDLKEGLMGSVHEMGHALYELGLPADQPSFPASKALDMAVHESQALFWERMIGQNRHFWKWIMPRVKKDFGYGRFDVSVSDDELVQALYESVNKVDGNNFIRVQADELHYPVHVMIRFFIERDLINGDLDVKDVPQRWNHDYHSYLGITPSNDSEGCLQDIHWYTGAVGYFPSYTLGAIGATQLFNSMDSEIEIGSLVSKGQFEPIISWLEKNVHSHGAMDQNINSLMKRVTGKELDTEQYVKYLENKYA